MPALENSETPCEAPTMPLGAAGRTEPGARSRWIARLVALASGLTGATVLFGWATGRAALTTLGSDISMKPNAAVCFLLLGAALWRRASRPGARDGLAFALAAAASAIGGLTLLEHLSGVNLGIDQLLFSEPPGMPATAAPARMGPPASTSFLLLGAALASIDRPRSAARVAVQLMAVATGCLALLPLVGYAYGTRALYGIARFTGIALPTTVLLEAVAVAVLLVAPGAGLMSALRGSGGEGQLARRTLIYSTVVPLTVGWLVAQGLHRALYDGVFAVSFLVLVLILSVTLLTWREAVHIGRIATLREAAEDARRESDEKARARASELEAVLDAVPAAVFITHDCDSRRVEGNRVAHELLGSGKGSNVSKTAPPEELAANYRLLKDGVEIPPQELPVQVAAARGVEVRDHELEIVLEDGRVRHLLGNAAPLHDAEGKARGAVGAFVDITARVKAEEELREADRRKDAFLAVLSHELRNPLAPIRNALFLLRRPDAGPEQASRSIAVIERQVSQLTRLVEDLLDLSRISSGKVQLQRTRLDLAELVRRTAEDYRGAAAAAGLDLTVDLPDGPLWIDGDMTRLAQAVGNLLSNAVKFTRPGGGVLVSAARDDATALLRVRDTGMGIDAAMRARLFEAFAQADSTLDRSRGGLGLGLTLVKGFVGLHGGTVEARSDGADAGAEFVVRLPLESAPPAARTDEATPPTAAPLRILIVEDNRDAAETLRDALTLSGHDVRVAHGGEDALLEARRSRPHAVICDIGLPGMTGYDVAHALRAGADTRGIVLIAVTGYASPEDRRRATEAGFDHHFGKPVDVPELIELLGEVSRTALATRA
jgi:PAS domain S-box-containing protein